jgi:hypothetical protein
VTQRERRVWALLWAGFAAVLAIKLLFISQHGTRDMDVALGWGHDLLARGLAQGYTGSNFPFAFQTYEGLVWFADHAGINEIVAMKGLNLLCDLGIFAGLWSFLRRAGHDPRWAFLYWLSPFTWVMWTVGYDHFQMTLLVVISLLLAQRARAWWGWLVAGVPLGIAFVQRPQTQGLVGAVGLAALLFAAQGVLARRSLRGALNERSGPAVLLLVPAAAFWLGYAVYFDAERPDNGWLLTTYTHLADFSPALSANMLNLWQAVAEAYRDGGEHLSQVYGPHVYHQIAGVLGAAAMVAGTVLIVRARGRRPFDATTLLLLFALGAIVVPNLYTRAHDAHFFLGGALAVLLIPMLPRPHRVRFAVLLSISLALQAFNTFEIYGFGLTPRSDWGAVTWLQGGWTYGVRLAAALVNTGLFVALLVTLAPLVRAGRASGDAGHAGARRRPPAPAARPATPA